MEELKIQMNKRKKIQEEKNKNSGFVGFFKKKFTTPTEFADEYQLNDQEKETLLKQINLDKKIEKMQLPKEYSKIRVAVTLNSVCLELVDNHNNVIIASLDVPKLKKILL